MPTIEERKHDDGSVSYRVKIRLKGRPQVSETFSRKIATLNRYRVALSAVLDVLVFDDNLEGIC